MKCHIRSHLLLKKYFTNGTFNLQCGAVQIRYNIRHIKPFIFDNNVEDISSKNMSNYVNIRVTKYILLSWYLSLDQSIWSDEHGDIEGNSYLSCTWSSYDVVYFSQQAAKFYNRWSVSTEVLKTLTCLTLKWL